MPSLAVNLVHLVLLTFSKECGARYSQQGGIEEHEAVPPNVQLMITGSKDPLDPVVLEEFRHDALRNAKILVELGKNELRTLSKLTGTVIGSDLLFGIPEQENYEVEEQYYGESFTDEGGDNNTKIANEYVKGRANKTNTISNLMDPEYSVPNPNAPLPNALPVSPSPPPPQPSFPPPYISSPPAPNTVPPVALPPSTNPPLPLPMVNNPQQQMPLPVPTGTQPIVPTNSNQQQMAFAPVPPPQPPVTSPVIPSTPAAPTMNNNAFGNMQQQAVSPPAAPISQLSAPAANGLNTAPPTYLYSAPPQPPSNQVTSAGANVFPATAVSGSPPYTTFQQPSPPQSPVIPPTPIPNPFVPQSSLNTPSYTASNTPFTPVNYPSPYIPVTPPNTSPIDPPTKPYNPLAGDPFHNSFPASPTWSTGVTPLQFSNPLSPSQPQYTSPPAAFQTQTQQGVSFN